MPKFTDAEGRSWTISVNVNKIKRVREECDGLDLLAVADSVVEKLTSDPVMLCDVLFVLCEKQAESAGVTSEQFGEALAGDAIEQATAAFVEGLIDFFPLHRRAAFRKAVEKIKELQARQTDLAMAWLDSPELEQQLEGLLQKPEFGSISLNSKAGSDST